MPLTPSRVLKQFKYAMYFDGVSGYIDVRNFRVDSQALTIALGIKKLVNNYSPGFEWVIHKRGAYWFGEFSITLESTGSSIFRLEQVDSQTDIYILSGVYYAEDLNWHNIATVYDGSTMYFYVDGSLTNSKTYNASRSIYTSNLLIGRHGSNAHYPYMLSYLLIYSRALSDSEILFNYYNPDNPVRDGLVLWLQADPNNVKDIDNDGILEWIDLSGYNNHGKVYGAQLVQLIKPTQRLLTPSRILSVVR